MMQNSEFIFESGTFLLKEMTELEKLFVREMEIFRDEYMNMHGVALVLDKIAPRIGEILKNSAQLSDTDLFERAIERGISASEPSKNFINAVSLKLIKKGLEGREAYSVAETFCARIEERFTRNIPVAIVQLEDKLNDLLSPKNNHVDTLRKRRSKFEIEVRI